MSVQEFSRALIGIFATRSILHSPTPQKSPLPFPPPPTPLCFPVSYLLPLKGLKDPTQSQEKMMMIVLLPAPPVSVHIPLK